MAAAFVTSPSPFLAPTSATNLDGAGSAAGGRLLLIHGAGAAAGRVLLFGPATALLPVAGRTVPHRPLCTTGGGGQEPLDKDDDDVDEATVKILRDAMQQLWVGVVVRGDEKLLDDIATVAKESLALLDKMVTDLPSPLPDLVYEDVVVVNLAFRRVEGECKLGYVTSNTVEEATRALKTLTDVFVGSAAAEALGPKPELFIIKNTTTKEEKDTYVKKLASAFSDRLNDVKNMYGRVGLAGGEGAVTASRRRPRSNQPSDEDFADTMAKSWDEALEHDYVDVVVRRDEKLLDDLTGVAKEAKALLDRMIKEARSPLTDVMYQDLTDVHTAFHAVERQCELGYVSSNSVVAAIRALETMTQLFVPAGAAEALGHFPFRVDYDGSKDATDEYKAAYVKKLATTFSGILRDVKTAYAGGAARD